MNKGFLSSLSDSKDKNDVGNFDVRHTSGMNHGNKGSSVSLADQTSSINEDLAESVAAHQEPSKTVYYMADPSNPISDLAYTE